MGTASTEVIKSEPLAVSPIASRASDAFMPVMAIQLAVDRYNAILNFTQQIMKAGKDYGSLPGIEKPTLLKPGAEKLCSFFGLTPRFSIVEKTEQWDGAEPFFYYWYKCQLWRGDMLIGEGEGSCNSKESKYRYRWVPESQVGGLDKKTLITRGGTAFEFDFSIDRAETSGKYGKPPSYWQAFKDAIANKTARRASRPTQRGDSPGYEIDQTVYRVPNPDVCDQVNTIQKMGQKRSMIAATLIACNASEYYTQDLEDLSDINLETTAQPAAAAATSSKPKQEPKQEPTTTADPGPVDPNDDSRITRDIPAELAGTLDQIRKQPAKLKDAFNKLGDLMITKAGSFGSEEYDRITKRFKERHPKVSDYRFEFVANCMIDLWEAYVALPDPAGDPQPQTQTQTEPQPASGAPNNGETT